MSGKHRRDKIIAYALHLGLRTETNRPAKGRRWYSFKWLDDSHSRTFEGANPSSAFLAGVSFAQIRQRELTEAQLKEIADVIELAETSLPYFASVSSEEDANQRRCVINAARVALTKLKEGV